MDFDQLSSKIFNGETSISFTINSNIFDITVFEDEFLLIINLKEHHYFDSINSLYYFIISTPYSQNDLN
jgi:hypothetical protein